MASEIRVNRLSNRSGLSTITFANGGVQFSGITTFANGDFRVGTGATILNPSTNEMQFHTGGSNRLTINNAGLNLGIGSITVGDATFTGSVSIGKTLTYEDVKNVDSIGVVTARTGVKITGGDFTVGTAITASSVTGNVTQDVGITTFSGSAVWFKGATANKDMYWSHASGSTVYKDNAQILMGDSSDLQIYHSGSHSFVEDTGAGVLSLKSNGSGIMLEHAGTGYMMKAFTGGAVEIYNNNSKKFETTSSGISVTGGVSISGSSTFTGNVFDFADSKQLRFGTGNDFELFFNGTDQYLKSKAGKIRVQVVDGESAITCNPNAGIELFYDDAKKFETTTNGVIIQGNANVSDSSGYGGSANHFFSAGNSNDLKLYHHGSWGSSYINNSGSGALFLESDDLRFRKANGTEIYFKAVADGAVELYHNNLKRFETTASGCLLGDSVKLQFGAGPDLEIYSDGSNSFVKCPDTGNNLTIESDQHLYIKVGDSEDAIKCVNGQAVELYHNGSKKFETTSTGVTVTGNISAAQGHYTDHIYIADKIVHTGDTNTWLRFPSNDTIAFGTGGTTKLQIGSNGDLTNTLQDTSYVTTKAFSNLAKLDIRGTNIANSNHYILSYGEGHANDHEFHMVNTVGDIAFRTGTSSTERLRIHSSGVVQIQDSTNATQGNAQLLVRKGAGGGAAPESITRVNSYMHLGGTEWGANAAGVYTLSFGYTNGTTGTHVPAYIGFKETTTSSYTQGDLVFGLKEATSDSGPTEQLRITSDGKFYLNDNSKKEIAPVYHDYVSCTGNAWTKFATIDGNQLSSEIYMTAQDTLNSVVITASFLIKVAHYQDIWIESRSMAYSELKIKVISNNNQNYDLYMQRTSGSTASNVEVSIFPKNQEGVTFSSNVNYSGQELVHTTASGALKINGAGGVGANIEIAGNLNKGSGSFKIPHPLASKKDTHNLVHSFLEGPQMDLIYRGKIDLVGGTATVNIDTKVGMTEGTFVALNRDVQCFTSNETGWGAVKGSVSGNILTITAQDNSSTDTISWMVVGERQDDTIKKSIITDDDGNLLVEPLIFEEPDNSSKAQYYPT